MRSNLVAMLDELGLHRYLRLSSTAKLFEEQWHRLYVTSALLYPVFHQSKKGKKNYSGGRSILRERLFVEMIERFLAPALAAMPQALIVPFGNSVYEAVAYLARDGTVDECRVLREFPHPSGANGHRHTLFAANKSLLLTNGCDVKTLQDQLGHSVPATTIRLYCHGSVDNQKRAVAALHNILPIAAAR